MSKRGRRVTRAGGGKARKARKAQESAPGALTCSIHGPGVDIDVKVLDAARLADLARTLMSGVGEGIVFMNGGGMNGRGAAPAIPATPPPEQASGGYDPALLRQTVAEDLRQMWEAMWKDGPVHAGDLESRDARFAAWVASPTGQSIIDDALSGGLGEPADPKLRQN